MNLDENYERKTLMIFLGSFFKTYSLIGFFYELEKNNLNKGRNDISVG